MPIGVSRECTVVPECFRASAFDQCFPNTRISDKTRFGSWDIFILAIILYTFFTVPLRLAFDGAFRQKDCSRNILEQVQSLLLVQPENGTPLT